MNELHLFAGAGGGILAGQLLGHRTVCAVEIDPYARSVLVARQNDGHFPPFPIWDDVCTFDGTPWAGRVDVVCGGFPCQDISAAGKGAGITGERSGLWKEFARIIGEVRPRFVFVENSPMLTIRGLGVVLGDLAAMGFNAEWGVLSASDVGANHRRERIWVFAWHSDSINDREIGGICKGEESIASGICEAMADTSNLYSNVSTVYREHGKSKVSEFRNGSSSEIRNTDNRDVERQWESTSRDREKFSDISNASWWSVEPNVGRVANGVAFRVDRLKAIGNGQVPLCAATAFKLLMERIYVQ